MVVHHGHHLGPRAVDLAVDEALEHRFVPAFVACAAVEVVVEQVGGLDALGRYRPRQKIALRILRRAHADVAVGVDHAVLGEDAVRRDQVFQKLVHQSAFMRAALTTRVQRAISAATSSPRRCGAPPAAFMPCLASASRMAVSSSSLVIARLSLKITSAGVLAGANTPYHVSTSRPARPCSRSVGTSRSAAERSPLIRPSARSLPDCTWGCAVCTAETIACTCPPTRSASAPAAPL